MTTWNMTRRELAAPVYEPFRRAAATVSNAHGYPGMNEAYEAALREDAEPSAVAAVEAFIEFAYRQAAFTAPIVAQCAGLTRSQWEAALKKRNLNGWDI
jgi:hypothetical protein